MEAILRAKRHVNYLQFIDFLQKYSENETLCLFDILITSVRIRLSSEFTGQPVRN